MSKRIAYFEYGRVYPQPEGVPLTSKGGAPVVPESEPEYDPPRLHICRVLLVFWCIGFASLHGSAYISVIQYPLEPADHVWQAIPIGALMALLAWGVTLGLRRCARNQSQEEK